ncbi:hypothetical protein [Roseobacter sp. HKCCA0434]|uniref:hypothetical protein n=1 Tax=Roseobacter sp. HKCCA0434 TaxID=3079297 RepID=UPI0029059926|nr:hypothetical protein [Roseobacter sp. HKCCA0434]
MRDRKKELPGSVAALIVFWPAVLGVIVFALLLLARLGGCVVSARGPEECRQFGVDIGGLLYLVSNPGYFVLYTFLWIPIGLILVGIIRSLQK